jgi:hypothetical protein
MIIFLGFLGNIIGNVIIGSEATFSIMLTFAGVDEISRRLVLFFMKVPKTNKTNIQSKRFPFILKTQCLSALLID